MKRGLSSLELLIILLMLSGACSLAATYWLEFQASRAITVGTNLAARNLQRAREIAALQGRAEVELVRRLPGGGGTLMIRNGAGAIVHQEAFPPQLLVETSWGSDTLSFQRTGGSYPEATGFLTITHPFTTSLRQIQITASPGVAFIR